MHSMHPRTSNRQWTCAATAFAACFALLGATDSEAVDKRKAVILATSGQTDGLPRGQIRGSIRGTLTDELRTFTVVTEEESQELLTNAKELKLNCTPDQNNCLLKLGILGNVSILISPVVKRVGRDQTLTISVFDVDKGAKVGEASRLLTSPDAAANAARSAMIEVIAPEKFRGRFALNVNVTGADVRVDGVSVGSTPLPAPLELKAGAHKLELIAEGYPTHESEIDVPFGKLSSTTITLTKEAAVTTTPPDEGVPPPATETPAAGGSLKFPVAGGLGAVAGLAGAVAVATWATFGFWTLQVFVLEGDGMNLDRLGKGQGLDTTVDIPLANIVGYVAIGATVAAAVFGGAAGAAYVLVE